MAASRSGAAYAAADLHLFARCLDEWAAIEHAVGAESRELLNRTLGRVGRDASLDHLEWMDSLEDEARRRRRAR